MTFFEAHDEKVALGINAVHAEVTDWNGNRTQVVFRSAAELEAYREFHREWAVTINEIA